VILRRPGSIRAEIEVPSDKSISHRSLMFNAIADGEARIERILESEDVRSTKRCLESLGVEIDWPEGSGTAVVQGQGLHGLFESDDVLDCGNSGTTMRLMAGLLAGNPLLSVLTGDDSLRTRPMARVITPLRQMGATLFARRGDTLPPLVIKGGDLKGVEYDSPVASAQVKSAILLAGLYAKSETTVREPEASRDHTERMLTAMGAPLEVGDRTVRIRPASKLSALSLRVPGDISSAAPWMVLAACHPDAEIRIRNVNVNPTRTGILDILRSMGAAVELEEERLSGGEPTADVVVRSSELTATEVSGAVVPRAIDELPLVAVLAAHAKGTTIVRDAAELRVKESDRVDAVVNTLSRMGVNIKARPDGFIVDGSRSKARLHGARVDGGGDHRIGMLGAIAGTLADGETRVENDAVGVSYPGFWSDLERATGEGVRA
jgi:3-phosphoshikimate 1-carboxyvinyltransferase